MDKKEKDFIDFINDNWQIIYASIIAITSMVVMVMAIGSLIF